MTDPFSLIPETAIKKPNDGKFASKLTFDERCAVLGLAVHGVKRDVLAKAFGVDKKTVGHIVSTSSLHYRSVRERFKQLGKDAFLAQYVTEDHALRVAAVAPIDATEPEPRQPNAPSHRSNRMAGEHTVQPPQCNYPHKIRISWQLKGENGVEEDGWYYQDLSIDETFLHNGDFSRKTSKNCYDAAIANLVDEI